MEDRLGDLEYVRTEFALVQSNVRMLKEVGHYIIEPVAGIEIADMRPGGGAMPPLETVMLSLKLIMAGDGRGSDAQISEK